MIKTRRAGQTERSVKSIFFIAESNDAFVVKPSRLISLSLAPRSRAPIHARRAFAIKSAIREDRRSPLRLARAERDNSLRLLQPPAWRRCESR